ncbi:MAG: hypothetical protein JWR07_5116 [Nevskia sp.]|nr:hypothetical protein [Nevskia sp.]
MSKKIWIGVGVVVLVLAAAAYFTSPILAFSQLSAAARSGDRDRLEQVVDFPAVRESLKGQISASVMKAMGSDPELRRNPFAALGGMLVPALTDRMVDSIVTPDGVAAMITQGKVNKPVQLQGQGSAAGDEKAGGKNEAVNVSYGYRTLDRFRVEVARKDDPQKVLSLTLERRGLFSWKLIRIELPDGVFGDFANRASPAAGEAPPPQPVPSAAASDDEGTGSDLCRAVALARVPALEDPNSALKSGEVDEAVTQYQVDKRTGAGSFCSHGGYCYPRYLQGKEVLQLQNCRIGKKFDDMDGMELYAIVLDRSKNSAEDLQYNDVDNSLLRMGMCSACASNAAMFYLRKPQSQCGLLVKNALEGNPQAQQTLNDNPDYCNWTDG